MDENEEKMKEKENYKLPSQMVLTNQHLNKYSITWFI